MKHRPIEIIARGVLIRHAHVLLCRAREAENTFLPGGHVEFGEPAATALEREIREELGINLKAGRFLGACEASFTQKQKPHHEINLVFELAWPPETRPADPRESAAAPAQTALPVLKSCENHIEFIWMPLSRVGHGSPVLLPRAIQDLVLGHTSFVSDLEL